MPSSAFSSSKVRKTICPPGLRCPLMNSSSSFHVHYCINNYDKPMKMISTLAPYTNPDKVEVENYTY